MGLELGENLGAAGIAGREGRRGSGPHIALDREALFQRRRVGLEAHPRPLRLLAGIHVRRVRLDADLAGTRTAKAGDVARQGKLDGIDETTLTSAVRPGDTEASFR